jgi:hypothetical protein
MTAIAHWVGVEDCTITIYNDMGDPVRAGAGKLIARHTAATEGVTLTVDDQALNRTLEPTEQMVDTVLAGDHTVAVSQAGSDTVLVEGSQVPVEEGTARIVYLVGTAKDDNLNVLTQTVNGLESNPSGVPTGNSGLAAGERSQPWLPGAGFVVAMALVAGAIRRRRATPGRIPARELGDARPHPPRG